LTSCLAVQAFAASEVSTPIVPRVFWDGVVHVTEMYVIDKTTLSITIKPVSESLGNIIVADEGENPISYEILRGQMVLHTLGATRVLIEYGDVVAHPLGGQGEGGDQAQS